MKVFFNQDCTNFFYFKGNEKDNYRRTVDFIRHYTGTDITDFLININGPLAITETKFFETFVDKYLKTEENGVSVDFKNTLAKEYYEFHKENIDVVEIWTRELKEMGINPWLSFRMNDCHEFMPAEPTLLRPEAIHKNPQLWRCGVRRATGYFDKNLNYNKAEVRELMLSYIEEQLSRYDVYGIELDFMRECYCFPEGEEDIGRANLLDFMNKVKATVNRIAEKRGHEIKIMITCQSNPISAYNNGFNISEYARLGLVDFIAAGIRWSTINLNMPVEIWQQLINGNAQFGCIQQLLINPSSSDIQSRSSSVDMAFGQAAAFTDCGADFIYLYNYFDMQFDNFVHSTSIAQKDNNRHILENIGKAEKLNRFNRRCPFTFNDSFCLFESGDNRLPLSINTRDYQKLRFVTGKIEQGQKAYLIIGVKTPVNQADIEVFANNAKAIPCHEGKEDKNILKDTAYTFEISPWVGNSVVACFKSSEECILTYAEILIEN